METKKTSKSLCSQPHTPPRKFERGVSPIRANFILSNSSKWVNGTEITFAFFQGAEAQKKVVRQAFQIWKNIGIGISFKEISNVAEAIVRIGFKAGDGSWSYVGRDVLTVPKNERTMNFGWDLTKDAYGMTTALHEIGHAIGFQHEHQSPFAGIKWNVKAVYKEFSGPPNNWTKSAIDQNIIQKLPANQTKGSNWDAKSIMEYEFGPGLVLEPSMYKNGIFPPGVISKEDKKGVKAFYPPIKKSSFKAMKTHQSEPIKADSGEQADFTFVAPETRKFTFQTVGELDTVMVVFEKEKETRHYLSGDDDSGVEKNAKISLPLVKGRTYIVNIRVLYSPGPEKGSLIIA